MWCALSLCLVSEELFVEPERQVQPKLQRTIFSSERTFLLYDLCILGAVCARFAIDGLFDSRFSAYKVPKAGQVPSPLTSESGKAKLTTFRPSFRTLPVTAFNLGATPK